MPDLTDLLRERAAAAPDPRPLTDAFVRRVRRRRAVRATLVGGGAVAGVVVLASVTAAVLTPEGVAIKPAVVPTPTATVPYGDDRYEFCTTPPTTGLVVTPYGDELKYNRGCYVATAGVPVTLTFTNLSAVPHNAVVAQDENAKPFAKTETLVKGGQTTHTVDLGTLAKGDYVLFCGLHKGMQAQLIAR